MPDPTSAARCSRITFPTDGALSIYREASQMLSQVERRPVQVFDTDVYEVGKTVQVMHAPVWDCRVWVDELTALTPEALCEITVSCRPHGSAAKPR